MIVSRATFDAMTADRDFWRARYLDMLQTAQSHTDPQTVTTVPEPVELLPNAVEQRIEDLYGSPASPMARQVRRAVKQKFPAGWDAPETVKGMLEYIIKGEDVPV